MVLAILSDASYLSAPNALSRVGASFMLEDVSFSPNNVVVVNISTNIKAVMSLVVEADPTHLKNTQRDGPLATPNANPNR
ncbi:hypothetical protein ACHAW6_012107 [Cyclotella cf. meneghiniana]